MSDARDDLPGANSGEAPPAGEDSGAARDRYLVTRDPLDLGVLIADATDDACGAMASFVGTVRSPNRGRLVHEIDYQGYEAMLLPQMREIGARLRDRWDVRRLVLAHRLGVLRPGDASIAIVVATPHRDAAFAACREALELCKERLPIWKYETDEAGSDWVEGRRTAAPPID